MARVRTKGTTPEGKVRELLRHSGYRFSTNVRSLPGSPDIVVTSKRLVVFVHGCFWHSHNCKRGMPPKTNTAFWAPKLERNVSRDNRNAAQLRREGWRVYVVWECNLKGGISRVLGALSVPVSEAPNLKFARKGEYVTRKKSR